MREACSGLLHRPFFQTCLGKEVCLSWPVRSLLFHVMLTSVSRLSRLEAQVQDLQRPQNAGAAIPPSFGSVRGFASPSKSAPGSNASKTYSAKRRSTPIGDERAQRSSMRTEVAAPYLALCGCTLTYAEILDLYHHFEDLYLPHCPFIAEISSLSQLENDSQLLLWTIILIATRHHTAHNHHYDDVRQAHARLVATICCEAIQNPLDIQAILLLCMWPAPVYSQSRDPSTMHLGMAISCALAMGLDKLQDETFFGTRRSHHQLRRFSPRTLRLTWLKCFELDVRMSLWNGTLPLLAASRYYKSVTTCCRESEVPIELAYEMEVYVRTSRSLRLLDDSTSGELPYIILENHVQDCHLPTASTDPTRQVAGDDLTSVTTQMYLSMACFVKLVSQTSEEPSTDSRPSPHVMEILFGASRCAIRVIEKLSSISEHLLRGEHQYQQCSNPLPGYPKYFSRDVFFATTVLLRYLDGVTNHAEAAQKDVRNAFQKAHLFFRKCTFAQEHVRAGETLEIAGRAIGSCKARVHSRIVTRMGASIRHDINWLSALLRQRDKDDEYSVDALPRTNPTTESEPTLAGLAVPSPPLGTVNGVAGDAMPDDSWAACTIPDGIDFPFGLWDDALFNNWSQNIYANVNVSFVDPI